MTTYINDNYIVPTHDNPSICIPRVYSDVNISFISNIFENKIKLGKIQKIDIITNNNDRRFNKVFIHFEEWYNIEKNNILKQKLYNGKIIKIVYDYPYFWKVALNNSA